MATYCLRAPAGREVFLKSRHRLWGGISVSDGCKSKVPERWLLAIAECGRKNEAFEVQNYRLTKGRRWRPDKLGGPRVAPGSASRRPAMSIFSFRASWGNFSPDPI